MSNRNGSVTDQYFFDPFGNQLGHTGNSNQHVTFGMNMRCYFGASGLCLNGTKVYDPASSLATV